MFKLNLETKRLLSYTLNLFPVFTIAMMIYYLYTILTTPGVWEHANKDKDDKPIEESVIEKRTQKRGLLGSLIVAVVTNTMGILLHLGNLKEELYTVNIGFIFANFLGFIADKMIGTDEGLGIVKTQPSRLWDYIGESVTNASFIRFFVTVVLDMFISEPILDVMNYFIVKNDVIPYMNGISGLYGTYSRFVAKNYASLLQSVVAVITFLLYTNATRFKWAYPSKGVTPIPTVTITMITTVASLIYVAFGIDSNIRSSAGSTRLGYMFITYIIISLMGDNIDDKTQKTKYSKFAPVLYVFMILYSVAYPVYDAFIKRK